MKLLTNKFFIIGNLLLLLITIPVTLFFVKKQQDVRSKAAPASKLSFNPASKTTSTQCQSFDVDIMIDPGTNIVSIVDFYVTYEAAKLDILSIKENTAAFPTVVRQASIAPGAANMSVSVGSDVTKAVRSPTKVATITLKAKAGGTAQLQFDSTKSRVFSLAPADQPTENVLLSAATPANIEARTDACQEGQITPTITAPPTVAPTVPVGPTVTANQVPVCTELSASPSSGLSPLTVTLTAKGNDPDATGTITKTTFNFGDGQTRDITEGMNLKAVTTQTIYTYQMAGTFGATTTFTDDKGAVNQLCSKTITVTSSASPTSTPSATATPAVLAPTDTPVPTAAPTIAPTGNISKTIGIIGGILLVILGGFALLAL